MDFLGKIQSFPLKIRKIILWLVIIILGIGLVWLWTKISVKKFQGFNKEDIIKGLDIPSLKEKIKKNPPEFPKLEIPGNITNPSLPN